MPQLQGIQSKGNYLNGAWEASSGTSFASLNPAHGTLLWQGSNATEQEIHTAWHSADQALHAWSALSFIERKQYTLQFAQQIEKNKDQLALLISLETGKPLWESYTEVTAVHSKINISIQAYEERTATQEKTTPEAHAYLRFKPQGVVAVLGAFNFPAHLSNGHIVPALLAGNTVIYKPSEQTPAVAEFIMQCWHESGLPAGVINCVQGNGHCGSILLSQDIQGVYFTGSYATGLRIHQQFNSRPEVLLALEMGGNNPLVLDEVTDINAAIYHTILSTFITSGQRCTCARRLIIPNSPLGDTFLERFLKASRLIKVSPFEQDPQPFMGPVISYEQALKHIQAQKKLMDSGGLSLLKMELLAEHTGLLSPGVMDMSAVSAPPDEELFAPLVQIYRYKHFDEAIQIANNTRYGLAAGLFSDKLEHYQQFYRSIRAGLINWNRPTTGAASTLPFGGVGLSGNHRPSAYFAADYCAYPIASMEQPNLTVPAQLAPGIVL